MRRTALTIVATIAALVLLLQFKTHTSGTTTGALASLGSAPTRTPSSLQPHSATPHPNADNAPTRHRHAATPTVSPPVTATGQTITTRYGPVQVRITETAGRLTDVAAIQLPSDQSRSREIAANAVPILRREALRADSAQIDVVSGATYTSEGYAQSLQSALDNA